MRLFSVIRAFASGCAVYLVMAACASERSPTSGSSSGGTSGSGTSSSGSLIDQLTNPVPDAKAAPEILTENCDKGSAAKYAEHAYPGARAAELAGSVTAMVSNPTTLESYVLHQQFVFVKDGFVAVPCDGTAVFIRRQSL